MFLQFLAIPSEFSKHYFAFKNCCVILLCINIYFLFIVQSLFSRGASSNYFFRQKVLSGAPLWCWSLWCWFSFKIKSSDFKNPPWLSSASQIVAEIIFSLSQTFQREFIFWMKKNVWWKKSPPIFDIKGWFFLPCDRLKIIRPAEDLPRFMRTNHLFCSSKTPKMYVFLNYILLFDPVPF